MGLLTILLPDKEPEVHSEEVSDDFLLAQIHRSLDRTFDTWEEFSQGNLTLDETAEVLETERILLVSIKASEDLSDKVRSKAKEALFAMKPFLETLEELDILANGDGSVRLGP